MSTSVQQPEKNRDYLYRQVAESLAKAIEEGQYGLGDKIPSEEELSEQFDVSRIVIRQAMTELVGDGVVVRKRGSGTYVSGTPQVPVIKIGLVCAFSSGLTDPFVASFITPLLNEMGERYQMVFMGYDSESGFIGTPAKHEDLQGYICLIPDRPHLAEKIAREFKDSNLPMIILNSTCPEGEVSSVQCDFYAGASELAKYAWESGERNVLLLDIEDPSNCWSEKIHGFSDTFMDMGDNSNIDILKTDHSPVNIGMRLVEYINSKPALPDFIFCGDDQMASIVLAVLSLQGFDVPRDIRIAGFNDLPASKDMVPSLTTVSVPFEEMTTHAFRLLKRQISEKGVLPKKQCFLNPRLIIRDSTRKNS